MVPQSDRQQQASKEPESRRHCRSEQPRGMHRDQCREGHPRRQDLDWIGASKEKHHAAAEHCKQRQQTTGVHPDQAQQAHSDHRADPVRAHIAHACEHSRPQNNELRLALGAGWARPQDNNATHAQSEER